jgi:hypothetical protein
LACSSPVGGRDARHYSKSVAACRGYLSLASDCIDLLDSACQVASYHVLAIGYARQARRYSIEARFGLIGLRGIRFSRQEGTHPETLLQVEVAQAGRHSSVIAIEHIH